MIWYAQWEKGSEWRLVIIVDALESIIVGTYLCYSE